MSNLKNQNHNLKIKTDVKKRSYKFSLDIIKFIYDISQKRTIFRSIEDQLLRSSTSIGANIVEAKASSSKREFIKYYDISLKSANETLYWLSLLKDSRIVTSQKIEYLIDECSQIAKLLASSIITMKKKKIY